MKRFIYTIILFPISLILVISLMFLVIGNNNVELLKKEYNSFFSQNFVDKYKELSKDRVLNLRESLLYDYYNIESSLKEELQDKLEIAYNIVDDTYKREKDFFQKEQIIKDVIKELDLLRFDEQEGYFFIIDFNTNHMLSHPRRELINKDFTNEEDIKGKNIINALKSGLESSEFTFVKMYFYKPNSLVQYPKLNSAFRYEPLDLLIGTGEYLDRIENQNLNKLIKKISISNKQKDNIIYIYKRVDKKSYKEFTTNKKIDDSFYKVLDSVESKKDLELYEYYDEKNRKYSFFTYIKEWEVILESNFHVDIIEKSLATLDKKLKVKVDETINSTLALIFWTTVLTTILTFLILNKIKNIILNYTVEIDEKNSELETILKTSIDGIAILDVDGKFLYFNEAYLKMTGYKKEELLDKKCKYLSMDTLKRVIKEGYLQNYETTISKKDEERIFLNISIALMPDKKTFLITVKDMTRLKKDEERIVEYLKLIDENIITSTTDLRGVITHVSKAFCEISGYSKEELIGKKHNLLRANDVSKEFYKKLWHCLKSDKVWEGEIKNRRKDGSVYWVYGTISPIYHNSKKVGYTAIRHDISDKKRVEELSITDGLTNLYNRRYFDDVFPRLLRESRKKDDYFSFILLDIDYFKQYNDTYGHQKGDEVLIEVSKSLKETLQRGEDLCFRLGGEEFGVIFKTTIKEKSILFANSIKNNIENLHIKHEKNSASEYVTVSIGLVCDRAENLPSFDEIYKEADRLLYKSKNSGRNRVSS